MPNPTSPAVARANSGPSPSPRWEAALSLDDLPGGSLRTWKRDGHQLVLARTASGEVHALDNRCPHEGYPLAQGTLRGEALTCCWHNWKFDVRDGRCVLGGEAVRSYPVRVRDGRVEVDLADPDPSERWSTWKESLAEGLHEHANGRALRDAVRLLASGYAPERLLVDLARQDAVHAEYGSTHALALAADCGRLVRGPDAEAAYAIAPVIDFCGEANRRMPPRPRPEPVAGATEELLRRVVEGEDAERAEALLRGAFAAGVPRATIEGWLYAVLSDHFLDFGHPLIYLVKAQELLDRDRADAGEDDAEVILGALLHSIVLGTREDTLPYWQVYARRQAEIEKRLPELWERSRAGGGEPDPSIVAAIGDAVLDGSAEHALETVVAALEAGTSAGRIARELVVAAARRLHRFDLEVDADPDLSENWLWVTHRFTFASAVRNAVERFASPDALRFLFQAVAFIHGARALDAPPDRRIPVEPRTPEPVEGERVEGGEDVVEAIAARDAERAVAGAAAAMSSPDGEAALRARLEDLVLEDPAVRPIVVAHVIKTVLAAFEEADALEGRPDRAWPVLAVVRFLASPVTERRVRETVRRSIRWVVDGVVPRKRTQ